MNKINQLTRYFILATCFFQSLIISAAETSVQRKKINYQLPHVAETINVDASLNESAWQQALKIELNYETDPGENTTPPVKTEVFLFENGDTLFVGFNAHDPDPSAIRDYLTDRDDVWSSDFVGIKFDTFGESRKAFQFFVNALGVQADATQEDFRGDDSNWDAIWDSAGRVTETGYIVEMAIPLRALRFPEKQGFQTWPMEILRFYPREFRHRIASSPVNRNIPCRVCQFDHLIGFSDIKPSKNLSFTPTLVVAQSDSREDAFSEWDEGDIDNEVGLDFRWGITQDIILNATFNPDFSQVEADSAQLDINNTFTIFLEEKRPFFLDGADYFNTLNRLVHTRDIIEPDFGLKVTGQNNGHSFGVFTADDKHTSFLVPGNQGSELVLLENAKSENQVLRYSYDLGNKNTIGVLVTNRDGDDYSNQVTSIDGKYWFDGNNSIQIQYMSSDSRYADVVIDEYDSVSVKNISDDAYSINFDHESRNWWAYASYNEFGKDFRADLGFLSRVNYDKSVIGLGYKWFPENNNTWWNKITLGGDWDVTYDNDNLKLEQESELNFRLFAALQSETGFGFGKRDRYYDGDEFDNTPGNYFDEQFIYFFSFLKPVEGLKIGSEFEWQDEVDVSNERLGESFRISPDVTWQFNRHWTSRLEYTILDFDVPDGDLFDAKVLNFRLTYQIDVRSLLRFTVQGLDIKRTPGLYLDDVDAREKSLNTQLLYSYKINPQTLFFAGYSDQGYQDDDLDSIKKTGRSLFMKFSYAWQL
ncbi:carbohydrate binding family 9 domain-containing protein [Aliikangiella coralliicola]|nr:carbohydrate binding family 9 domain-containing protein [Aliikangiella coralliicola]